MRKKSAIGKKMIEKKITIAILITAFVCFLTAGCGSVFAPESPSGGEAERGSPEDEKLSVVCTIFPQYDFVRQIAGDRVNLKMLIRPGGDVHYYEPSPQDIIDISGCDLFIYVGGESDVWADSILESADRDEMEILSLMECTGTLRQEEMSEGMWDETEHGIFRGRDGGEETEYDEHVWTSVSNSMRIVSVICEKLCGLDPENESYYRERTAEYIEELESLKRDLADVVQNAQRNTIVFGDRFPLLYFAREFGLDYRAAFKGCSSNSEAGAETVAYLIDLVRQDEIPVVFKLELSTGNIASAISEATGAEVLTFYSCHNLSKEDFESGETYLSMMRKNVRSLEEALN